MACRELPVKWQESVEFKLKRLISFNILPNDETAKRRKKYVIWTIRWNKTGSREQFKSGNSITGSSV